LPESAKQAPVTKPTYPVPNIVMRNLVSDQTFSAIVRDSFCASRT